MAWTPTTDNPYRWLSVTKTYKRKGITLETFAICIYQVNMRYVKATPAEFDEYGVQTKPAQTLPVKAAISFKLFNSIESGLEDFENNTLDDFSEVFYFNDFAIEFAQIRAFLRNKYAVTNQQLID